MLEKEDWTTIVTYYKTPEIGAKCYHLEINVTSVLGSTHLKADTATLEQLLNLSKTISSTYQILIEQAPIIRLRNAPMGVRFEEREEHLLLQALRGE